MTIKNYILILFLIIYITSSILSLDDLRGSKKTDPDSRCDDNGKCSSAKTFKNKA